MPWPNGLYHARNPGSATSYALALRVDLRPAAEESYVSLDLYEGFLAPGTTPDEEAAAGLLLFLGSFRSEKLTREPPGPSQLSVTLTGVGEHLGTISLQLQAGRGQPGRIRYTAADAPPPIPAGPIDFEAEHVSDSLRVVKLEVDVSPPFPRPFTATGDLGGGRTTNFIDCCRRAGLEVHNLTDGDSDLPRLAEWTLPQLVNLAHTKPPTGLGEGFWGYEEAWSLSLYQMIATRLSGSGTTIGWMFDGRRRSASAVFYQTLRDHFERDDDGGAELAVNYLMTAVHEVAHSLNLPHAFEEHPLPGLSAAVATFSNYPWRYEGDPGGPLDPWKFRGPEEGWDDDQLLRYRTFWSAFKFIFHAGELLELRHGARRDIETGGIDPATGLPVRPYRGGPESQIPLTLGGPTGAGLELVLRVQGDDRPGDPPPSRARRRPALRSRPVFEFGEPIHVEARLRSYLPQRRPVARPLSVVTGDLRLHYQTPDGRWLAYVPPCALCTLPAAPKWVRAGRRKTDSLYKDICLNLGTDEFRCLDPGLYRVRASYRYLDTLLVSNVLELYVRHPTREVEDLVVPLLDPGVATYLAFRGAHGLPRADARLAEAFLDDRGRPRPDVAHPLLHYYCAGQARVRRAGAWDFDATRWKFRKARLEHDELHWLPRAFGLNDPKDVTRRAPLPALPFSNIALGKLGRLFHDVLREDGSPRVAAALARKLHAALADRQVPADVCNHYLPDLPGGRRGRTSRR
jgi:hypothetical protein